LNGGLEWFDMENCTCNSLSSSLQVNIEEIKFASGGFRDAYLAKCVDSSSALRGDWVVKKFQDDSVTTIADVLKMSTQDHTRQQVQMHSVARNITARFTTNYP